MDLSSFIRNRLRELGLEQKNLAAAAGVSESYISQLLGRKKHPPKPGRTELYEKMGDFLRLPKGELSQFAQLQRQEELKRKIEMPPAPLFRSSRELTLRKCNAAKRDEIERIFENQAFGELERMVTQKLLDVAQNAVREGMRREEWWQRMADATRLDYEEMRSVTLEFLATNAFDVSIENCVVFIDPIIDSWDMDLKTFGLEIVLATGLARHPSARFEFVETKPEKAELEPGLELFLKDRTLSGDATQEEIEFLRGLGLGGRRPSALYYYRELQNLRDPLHFDGDSDRAPAR